ncbi:hypothetical protein F9B85_09470 [Heliorestis acidaminivorans]|uniref:Uncharacterized protein n=1 Tax=Heliorestis acidaminivorans TaxID=553427 RepID=A0A6I0ERU1_9FIRM|nr:hypothetical protein [Heliorestis acidaminivorans]KAB2952373.1 hypothetical protein F9B85_09470 [Heliorestis acidaminivorans]
MERWIGWPIERYLILFTSIAFLLIAVQATLYHYRQNFRHWAMWGPTIGLPVAALVGFLLTWRDLSILRWLFLILLVVELFSGLSGFYYHGRGVSQRVGGWDINNVMVGPPFILPLMVSGLSIFGLLALLL